MHELRAGTPRAKLAVYVEEDAIGTEGSLRT